FVTHVNDCKPAVLLPLRRGHGRAAHRGAVTLWTSTAGSTTHQPSAPPPASTLQVGQAHLGLPTLFLRCLLSGRISRSGPPADPGGACLTEPAAPFVERENQL